MLTLTRQTSANVGLPAVPAWPLVQGLDELIPLADAGGREAARIALLMAARGPRLFGQTFPARHPNASVGTGALHGGIEARTAKRRANGVWQANFWKALRWQAMCPRVLETLTVVERVSPFLLLPHQGALRRPVRRRSRSRTSTAAIRARRRGR